MKTSKQWWNEIKNDPRKLKAWLRDQYHGEITAARRIKRLAKVHKESHGYVKSSLLYIASQEKEHASWVAKLLTDRGMKPSTLVKTPRYWTQTLPRGYTNLPLEQLLAIGAKAEKMRLSRIRAIASDKDAPEDIRKVFQDILPQERFHERYFRRKAGAKALRAANKNHKKGLNALGLVA